MKRPLAVTLVLLAAGSARAAPSCKNISVTNLVFGSYDVFNAAATDSAGTISYSCPPPTTPGVTIDLGLAFGNGTRRMTISSAGQWLAYEVYVDAARTLVWSSTLPVSVPAGNNMTAPYYGRVFPLQDVSVGAYSDTLVVTFNF